ncbi:MAG: ferritin family protein [Candidatus Scalindua sp.]|jgi:rubrerythrin|nr:ferritin family protein [Candidatus Scalindua sp.]MDV5166299.1 ferritin family protein [Candidatus Scalindua sp.]
MQNENIESILKKAAAKEEGTYLLYKNAADKMTDLQTKSTLNTFAEEELKHKQVIENFNAEMLEELKVEAVETSRQGITEFLTDTDEGLGEQPDFKDVLVYAAKREKKAYEFYSNMSEHVEDADLKKLFVWLAQEETKHKEDIETLFWDVMYRE